MKSNPRGEIKVKIVSSNKNIFICFTSFSNVIVRDLLIKEMRGGNNIRRVTTDFFSSNGVWAIGRKMNTATLFVLCAQYHVAYFYAP